MTVQQWRAQNLEILGIGKLKNYKKTRQVIFLDDTKKATAEGDSSKLDTLIVSLFGGNCKGGKYELRK